MTALVAWLFAIPLMVAPVALIASHTRVLRGAAWLVGLVQTGLVLTLYVDRPAPVDLLAWLPALNAVVEITADTAAWQAVVVLTLTLLVALGAEAGLQTTPSGARLALTGATYASLCLFLLTTDLLIAAAAHGTAMLLLATLLGLTDERAAAAAARRFAVAGAAGTFLLLLAAGVLAAHGGGTSLSAWEALAPEPARRAAVALALAAALMLPLVPCHSWLAPVMASGSLAGRVLVVGGWCTAGAFAAVRFGAGLVPEQLAYAAPWPHVAGLVSLFWGASLALAAPAADATRRLAAAIVAGGGLVLVGVASISAGGVAGAWLFALASALPRTALLLLACHLATGGSRDGGSRDGGWRDGGRQGGGATALWIALCLAAAAPGSGAFAGGFLVFLESQAWTGLFIAVTGVGALLALLSVARRPAAADGAVVPSPVLRAAALALLVTVVCGLLPGWLLGDVEADIARQLERVPLAESAAEEVAP